MIYQGPDKGEPEERFLQEGVSMYRILIVEDDAAVRRLYREELTDEGYTVTTTNRYAELIRVIRECRPDLILFDVRTGQISDLDLLCTVRELHPEIPIVLCSACPEVPTHSQSCITDYYLGKSSDLNGLKIQITAALSKKAMKGKRLQRDDNRMYCPQEQRSGLASRS